MSAVLSNLSKESSVVDYLQARGFRRIPPEARPLPDAFTNLIFGSAYAAAYELEHQGKRLWHIPSALRFLDSCRKVKKT
jgi:hypothetical protein